MTTQKTPRPESRGHATAGEAVPAKVPHTSDKDLWWSAVEAALIVAAGLAMVAGDVVLTAIVVVNDRRTAADIALVAVLVFLTGYALAVGHIGLDQIRRDIGRRR